MPQESSQSYGDAFADIYDEWYSDVTDVDATTSVLARLAGGGNVLELGVGTGRIAIPLAAKMPRERTVVGVDSSQAMLDICSEKLLARHQPGHAAVELHCRDMAREQPAGPFSVIFCTFNTFFNLDSAEAQQLCLHEAAHRLTPGGAIVLEITVFETSHDDASTDLISTDLISNERVNANRSRVTSRSRVNPNTQIAEGEFSTFSINGIEQRRPWRIRYSTPAQIDEMAVLAGLVCTDRWEDFSLAQFHSGSASQVCVLRRKIIKQ